MGLFDGLYSALNSLNDSDYMASQGLNYLAPGSGALVSNKSDQVVQGLADQVAPGAGAIISNDSERAGKVVAGMAMDAALEPADPAEATRKASENILQGQDVEAERRRAAAEATRQEAALALGQAQPTPQGQIERLQASMQSAPPPAQGIEPAQPAANMPQPAAMPEAAVTPVGGAQPPATALNPDDPQGTFDDLAAAKRQQAQTQALVAQAEAARQAEMQKELQLQSAAQVEEANRMQQVAAEAEATATQKLEEISSTEIDPLRVWTDAPLYGKAIAAIILMVSKTDNLPQVFNMVGGYIARDIDAQKADRNSQVAYWTDQLGNARLGQKAAGIKMAEGLKQRLEEVKAGPGDQAANKQLVLDTMESELQQSRMDLGGELREFELKKDAQSALEQDRAAKNALTMRGQNQSYELGKERNDLQRLGQQMASVKTASASSILSEMKAQSGIKEMQETGRTPERNKEIRGEIAKAGSQLTKTLEAMTALDLLHEEAGITRDENGKLRRPDGGIKGVGWWDSSMISTLTGGKEERTKVETAKTLAIEAFGRMQSGGVIGDEELVNFTKMIGNSSNETEFFLAQQAIDEFLQGKANNIRASMSQDAQVEYARLMQRPQTESKPKGVRKVGTIPRKSTRDKSRDILEGKF